MAITTVNNINYVDFAKVNSIQMKQGDKTPIAIKLQQVSTSIRRDAEIPEQETVATVYLSDTKDRKVIYKEDFEVKLGTVTLVIDSVLPVGAYNLEIDYNGKKYPSDNSFSIIINHSATVAPEEIKSLETIQMVQDNVLTGVTPKVQALVDAKLSTEVANYVNTNKAMLKGDKGDKMKFTDLTVSEKESLKGEQGIQGVAGVRGDAPNFLNINAEYDVTIFQPIATDEYNAMRYFRDTSNTDEFMKGYDNYVARYGTSEVTKTIKEDYSKVTKGTVRVIEGNDNNYTSEVGTTIEHTFTGYSISMTSTTNNQGGMWKASIDGNFVKNISVYGGGTVETFLISDELENKEHTLVLEFIGQDPDNPVSSPRGWIRVGKYNTLYSTFTILKKESVTGVSKVIDVAYPVSNKEYAICVRPKGSTGSPEFFPYHGVQTSFKGENYVRQLIVDGVQVDLTKKKENIQFKEARLIQKVEHKLSTDTSIRMECTFIVTFKDSKVYNDIRFKWIQPSQITSGYVFQMPFDYNWFDSVVVDLVEQVNKSDEFGSQSDFNNDNAKVYTGFSNNGVGKDYIYQCVINKASMPVDRLWLQHRDDKLQKLYPQYYNATVKEAGDIDVFNGYYEILKIKDANKIYKV